MKIKIDRNGWVVIGTYAKKFNKNEVIDLPEEQAMYLLSKNRDFKLVEKPKIKMEDKK